MAGACVIYLVLLIKLTTCCNNQARITGIPSVACIGPKAQPILRRTELLRISIPSPGQCFLICSSNVRCTYAVFFSNNATIENKCVLLSDEGYFSPAPDYTTSSDCRVLHICHNGGESGDNFTCSCLPGFLGHHCQLEDKGDCQSAWTDVYVSDENGTGIVGTKENLHPISEITSRKIKVSVAMPDGSEVIKHITHFTKESGIYVGHALDSVVLNDNKTGLHHPVLREFNLFLDTGHVETVAVSITGSTFIDSVKKRPLRWMVRASVPKDNFIYDQSTGTGIHKNLLKALKKGGLSLDRSCLTVSATHNAIAHGISTSIVASTAIDRPLRVICWKAVARNGEFHSSVKPVGGGEEFITNSTLHRRWEIDKCYRRLELQEDAVVSTLAGNYLRLVLDNEYIADVYETKIEGKQIRAYLHPFLTPRGFGGMNDKMRIRWDIVSWNLTAVKCLHRFEGHKMSKKIQKEKIIAWYVSTHSWNKKLTVTSRGTVLLGSVRAVREAARRGYNVRVCLTDGTDLTHLCVAGHTLTVKDSGEVILQSYPGSCFTNCARTRLTVSTSGWAIWVQYQLPTEVTAQWNEKNKEIVWFVEDFPWL